MRFEDWRAGDQRYFVANTRQITKELGLSAAVPWKQGVARLADWLAEARDPAEKPEPVLTRLAA